jgi:hypothetical protein
VSGRYSAATRGLQIVLAAAGGDRTGEGRALNEPRRAVPWFAQGNAGPGCSPAASTRCLRKRPTFITHRTGHWLGPWTYDAGTGGGRGARRTRHDALTAEPGLCIRAAPTPGTCTTSAR